MKTIILDIGDESADWIKIFKNIVKAKVYVKNKEKENKNAD